MSLKMVINWYSPVEVWVWWLFQPGDVRSGALGQVQRWEHGSPLTSPNPLCSDQATLKFVYINVLIVVSITNKDDDKKGSSV